GVVYAAYDPELDRRIAVKLVRTRQQRGAARARARLVREAQAMARLTHPNVAVVHDVGTHEDDVFVAMEFIRGETLQAWLRERPRGWREVVEVFVQAGRGLAAAHAAGLVHRDFKPANAMIGDDGRVRVLDFGLCFAETTDTETSGEGRLDLRITRKEEVVGTPAYMPPEQFMQGGVVGPASDQFSFCASLYEALYGQLPFAGDTVQAVSMAIAAGELRPPPRGSRVPLWLASAVQRGLRPQASERFASMEALLRVLGRSRSRARGSVAIAAVLAVATGLAGFVAARSQALGQDPCSGGAQEIAEVWGGARRAAAEQALIAAGPAYAEELWPPVASELDSYADQWQGMHREACLAHRRGETSGALLDRRMACLARRKAALAEAGTVLGGADAEVALHALEVVEHLPGLDGCADLDALANEVAAPGDLELRARADRLRPRLARVRTLSHAGLTAMAVNEAELLREAAEGLGEPGLLAEVLIQRGRMAIDLREGPGSADHLLTRAYLVALAARLDELAAEALALRLYVRGR
ncbi:MAG: serine/threonine protein kinase, partial [Myxococcales bacterium]|nr:serine/threonine protein kinase [Myxococcales bacterium]